MVNEHCNAGVIIRVARFHFAVLDCFCFSPSYEKVDGHDRFIRIYNLINGLPNGSDPIDLAEGIGLCSIHLFCRFWILGSISLQNTTSSSPLNIRLQLNSNLFIFFLILLFFICGQLEFCPTQLQFVMRCYCALPRAIKVFSLFNSNHFCVNSMQMIKQ